MSTVFSVILEEFEQELDAIRVLVAEPEERPVSARARVAGANAALLLLAATFEEFVRELAREFARAVVAGTEKPEGLPSKMAATAWKRTLEALARIQPKDSTFSDAQARFVSIFEFCRGDLGQDIFNDLIHNENNMRPEQLNSMFKVSGLGNVCLLSSDFEEMRIFFGVQETNIAHGKLIEAMEDFFNRRNQTAHEIRAMQSASSDMIRNDVNLLQLFGKSLVNVLEARAPPPLNGA